MPGLLSARGFGYGERMKATTVCPGVWRLSADLSDLLFEGLWPIPNGVSLSSYLVRGEKTALIDGVCGWDGVPETLFAQLETLGIPLESIDYVVINHMEPDHSGWLEAFRRIRPQFQILTSERSVPLLKAFFGITDQIRTVKDGDTLDLGNGRVLTFAEIPNVHWPETIATFDTQSGTLFPCDAFGSFGALGEAPYDDQLSPEQLAFFEKEAVRYYANIVAAFSGPTGKAIDKVEKLLGDKVKIIAPGHGIVWRQNPAKILSDYRRYVSYQKNPAKAEVSVIWGSMYGNTEKALDAVVIGLSEMGVHVKTHRVPDTSIGDLLASVWTSTGVVLGMPSYEFKMFPPLAAALDELFKKKVHNRLAFRFGSFGWCGGAQNELDDLLAHHKPGWQFLDPVEFQGAPRETDLANLRSQGRALAKAVLQSVTAGTWTQLLQHQRPLDGTCEDLD